MKQPDLNLRIHHEEEKPLPNFKLKNKISIGRNDFNPYDQESTKAVSELQMEPETR